jgi:glucose-6-phosphate 1-dehydrogenase
METKQKNVPTVFIIFGATGDLMTKKIVPALFHLYLNNNLPKLFRIIGFSRRDLTEEQFRVYVSDILKGTKEKKKKEDIEQFLQLITYQHGDFDKPNAYQVLAKNLGIIDDGWSACSNKLFYLAVPPIFYKTIFQHLADSGLTIPCGGDEGWTRVLVEKPFGNNLKTAEDLDMMLARLFKEEQLYRIDHYLGKEMLQNILEFRFANALFEGLWNNRHVKKIEVRILESLGVENRGAFYDGVGALRDVGQNHILQMLSLVTMDRPATFESTDVRQKRAEIFSFLKRPTPDRLADTTFRGQYNGYKHIAGVNPKSPTETYFKVITEIENDRWRSVPIILEGGKKITTQKRNCRDLWCYSKPSIKSQGT